jgi:transposase-like protein
MRKAEKSNGRPSLHAMKVAEEPTVIPPPEAVVAPPPAAAPAPDPEVPATARRRAFTAEFKRQVLAEADAAEPGGIGAVLRRHGLYSSHLVTWRHQRDAGELAGLAPRKRGRKPAPKNPLAEEMAKLQRDLARATARAERAEGLVAVQKKLAELLGEELPSEEELLDAERRGLPIPPPRKKR